MKTSIQGKLRRIELEHGVKIIYACESGSRAWGFASEDSDYDVRFIYVRPVNQYLSIFPRKDVIEYKIDTDNHDINGWDLKKTLALLAKSNPPLMEWLGSPFVYLENHHLILNLRLLAKEFYSPQSCLYHYLHMAVGNFRQYLAGDVVWTKKYLYVLRPIFAANWIERGLGIVPTEFNDMLDRLVPPGELRSEINKLLAAKRAGKELRTEPKNEVIGQFIEFELNRFATVKLQKELNSLPYSKLDDFFLEAINCIWEVQHV